jgi:peptide/nickel transport system permease protein
MNKFIKTLLEKKVVLVSAIILLIFIILALGSQWIAPHNPNKQDMYNTLKPVSWQHLLGTDNFGRDILSRVIYGSRISLLIGVLAVGIASVIGSLLGLLSGYFGGIIDSITMRIVEMILSIPQVIFAIALAAVLGGGVLNLTIILGFTAIPGYTRLMRAQVLTVKEMDYIQAQKIIGSSNARIIFSHVLQNSVSPMIIMMTQTVGFTILAEAGLSFLGVGIMPPTASWGGMISDGKSYLMNAPILAIAPGVCVALLVMSLNFMGDGLRDILDPRLRGTF